MVPGVQEKMLLSGLLFGGATVINLAGGSRQAARPASWEPLNNFPDQPETQEGPASLGTGTAQRGSKSENPFLRKPDAQ